MSIRKPAPPPGLRGHRTTNTTTPNTPMHPAMHEPYQVPHRAVYFQIDVSREHCSIERAPERSALILVTGTSHAAHALGTEVVTAG